MNSGSAEWWLIDRIWTLAAVVVVFLGLALAKDSLLVAAAGVLAFMTVLAGSGLLATELRQRRAQKRIAMPVPAPPRPHFSLEEQAVMRLLAQGLTIGQIAYELNYSYAWASILTLSVMEKHAATARRAAAVRRQPSRPVHPAMQAKARRSQA